MVHFFIIVYTPILQVGQEIEVRPGIVSKTQDGKIQCIPIFSRIVSLFTEQNELQYAVPGGLIGRSFVMYLRKIPCRINMPEFNKQLPHALHALHLDEFVSKITERKILFWGHIYE